MSSQRIQRERWSWPDVRPLYDGIVECFRSGNPSFDLTSPFGDCESRADFRGFQFPDEFILKDLELRNIALDGCSLCRSWVESCIFDNVSFDCADLPASTDQGNTFLGCSFVQTNLKEAFVGYQGSHYQSCFFQKTSFLKATFIRPEFDNCRFDECKLRSVDFSASSFEDCSFSGVLNGVWFRGGFGYPSQLKEFGKPRKNTMAKVSFEKATLVDVNFSHGCDLSSVTLPLSGDYRKYSDWSARLHRLEHQIESWPDDQKAEAQIFTQVFLGGADGQEWFILNCDDVLSEYDQEVGKKIIDAL